MERFRKILIFNFLISVGLYVGLILTRYAH